MRDKIAFEGIEVTVRRSKTDGRIVVEIETDNLGPEDIHEETAVPNIVVFVNDERSTIDSDGKWVVE